MGVYINMEMPTSCNGCPVNFVGHCMAYNGLFVERKSLEYNSKPDWCPLIPVPPHGDLIERKAIALTDFEIAMCDGDYKEGMKMLLEKIESAPTIIPPDEEADNV